MSVLVEYAMFPTDKGESVSKYVSRIIKMIKENGIDYRLTPMGTVFETKTMEEAMNIIHQSYQQLAPDCNRIYSTVKFDIRKDKENRITGKIKSIENQIGKTN